MHITTEMGVLTLHADRYMLAFAFDRPFVYLGDRVGNRLADLFVLSSLHSSSGGDDTTGIGIWQVDESVDEICLTLNASSSVWKEKIYRFRCRPHRFTYEVEVTGTGDLTEFHPFGGYYSGNLRWGSGFFPSGQVFEQGFNPEPNREEISYFSPAEGTVIDLTGVPLPGKATWFFTPPPHCFAFQSQGIWIGVGVEAAAGHNTFTDYRYNGQRGSFYLSRSYEGHTTVSGRFHLPAIGFDFGENEYGVISRHVEALRTAGHVPVPVFGPKPDWWYEPIYCGWGSQCHIARQEKGHAPDYAQQTYYDGFLTALTANRVSPGIVVLDDKWQASYGNNEVDKAKWPDLPGFIYEQHELGRKILLWLKAWDPEGVPAEECIRNAAGLPLSVDPTNPACEERLRHSVRRMLSAEGYDADGFKIDFSARIPTGPGIRTYGKGWGLELMRRYLSILYDEAKRVKPDALIMAHTPHPYLADVIDMIRLNDINTGQDVNRAMLHRTRIAVIACPSAVIDTDNWPITDRQAWRRYLPLQTELGVPALYYATHIDSTGEALEEDDYRMIRDVWCKYRARRRPSSTVNGYGH
jgi:hypothetical protein